MGEFELPGAAALLGYVVFAMSFKFAGMYDLETRIRHVDLVVRGVSVVASAVLSVALWRNDKANQFMNEVMVELSRVTWPTQKDTSSATIVVVIMVLISGMVLGLLDYFWTALMKWVL